MARTGPLGMLSQSGCTPLIDLGNLVYTSCKHEATRPGEPEPLLAPSVVNRALPGVKVLANRMLKTEPR